MVDVFEFSDRMNCRVLAVFGTREALKSDPMSVSTSRRLVVL